MDKEKIMVLEAIWITVGMLDRNCSASSRTTTRCSSHRHKPPLIRLTTSVQWLIVWRMRACVERTATTICVHAFTRT